MASSGSFNTSAYSDSEVTRYLVFEWSIQSQSIANNTTTISWTLRGAGNPTSYWVMSGNFSLVIDGSTVYSSSDRIALYGTTTVASGTKTLTHANDGTRSFSASAEAGIYTYAVNCTGSGTWSLTAIPRYATVSQSLAAKTETTASINWSSDSTVDYIWYSSDGGTSWAGLDVADGTSGTYTISGLSENTVYSIKTRVRRKDSQLTTDSTALSVTTYNYPYASTMPDFVIGNKLTIKLYNPLGRTISVAMVGDNASEYAVAGTVSGTSISGFYSSAWASWWYSTIPSATSGTYSVKVTYGSQTQTRTGGTYTIKEADCAPYITAVTYGDTNTTVTAVTRNPTTIVRNLSTVSFTASGLNAQYGASVASCSLTVNGTTYAMTLNSTSSAATLTGVVIDSSANITATYTVTDSRGVTGTMTATVTMADWSSPTAIITMQRKDHYYTETYITVDATFAAIGSNALTIALKAKKVGTSSYTITGSLADNTQYTYQMDNAYAWNVVITVSDTLGGSTTYNLVLSRGMPIIYFDRERSSVGINTLPTEDGSLEIDGVVGSVARLLNILNGGTAIASGDDFDDCITVGAYLVQNANIAAGVSNIPEAIAGKLIVINANKDDLECSGTSQYFLQFYLTYTGNIYRRRMQVNASGVFSVSSWESFAIGISTWQGGSY